MPYSRGSHTAFHHRYHIVWAPKYRFKVLHGEVRLRVREIIRQVCSELGVTIIHGALSRDHVHMFVEIPPHIAVSDFVLRAKGRSSRKIQQEFEHNPTTEKRGPSSIVFKGATNQPSQAGIQYVTCMRGSEL